MRNLAGVWQREKRRKRKKNGGARMDKSKVGHSAVRQNSSFGEGDSFDRVAAETGWRKGLHLEKGAM